ncbi:hypothetical protein AAC03nite_24640 [Alicyclobacillus acidoterrestris]|nr:hypothetical protein AAC03nite_24640 [Alicyclobacillus acidoterrestris]
MGARDWVSKALRKAADRVAPSDIAPGNLAPSSMTVGSNEPPPQTEQAMQQQGMVTGGPFAPGRPLDQFFPQGQPPRQWDYETGYNVATRPRAVESKMSFETMRALLDNYDVARLCIERREDEIRGLDWSIVPDVTVDEDEDLSAEIDQVTTFFAKPDGVTPFDSWQQSFLDDVLSFDAGTIFVRKTRAGKIGALEIVDGTTVAPLIDFWGRVPDPPAPAFVQFVQGIPAVWLRRDELIYHPFRTTPRSPYGMPPIEWLVLTVNTDIRWQWHFLMYFTEGNVPDTFMKAPPDLSSPEQLKQWQELWDSFMTGDQAWKHKVKWIPNGADPIPAKSVNFDPTFPEFLLKKTCAAFKVTPDEIGFTGDSNRSVGQTQENIMYRASLEPLVKYLEGIYTRIIREYFGYPLKFRFDLGEKEDKLLEAQASQILVQIGALSPDEVRKNVAGLDPDPEHPVGRFIQTNMGPLPIEQIGKFVPYTWVPQEYSGYYQLRGTPLVPNTTVSVQPQPGPDGGPPPFAQAAMDQAQQAVDQANQYAESNQSPDETTDTPLDGPSDDSDDGEAVEKMATPDDKDVFVELRRWKQNSKRRVKQGKPPRQFDSDILPDELHDQVWGRLQQAKTPEEVDAAFAGPFFW